MLNELHFLMAPGEGEENKLNKPGTLHALIQDKATDNVTCMTVNKIRRGGEEGEFSDRGKKWGDWKTNHFIIFV